MPQRIEIIEEKLGNSPGSRHSPVVPADKKQIATPERAPPSIPALTPDKPDKPASVQKPSPMEKRYAELAEPASYDKPPSPESVPSRSGAGRRRSDGGAPIAAAGARLAGVAAGARLVARTPRRPSTEKPQKSRSSVASFSVRARRNDCTWASGRGAPGRAESSGCFNPFADGRRTAMTRSVRS